MKNIILIFLLIAFYSSCINKKSQNKKQLLKISNKQIKEKQNKCDKCEIACLVELSENINNPTDRQIENFLLTFDKSCKNNAEYSEFSNELLFDILFKYPKKVIKILNRNKKIKFDVILNELTMPINDGIDIKKIIEKLQKIDNPKAKKIVDSLLKIE